jgi:hypothetical protein
LVGRQLFIGYFKLRLLRRHITAFQLGFQIFDFL